MGKIPFVCIKPILNFHCWERVGGSNLKGGKTFALSFLRDTILVIELCLYNIGLFLIIGGFFEVDTFFY